MWAVYFSMQVTKCSSHDIVDPATNRRQNDCARL